MIFASYCINFKLVDKFCFTKKQVAFEEQNLISFFFSALLWFCFTIIKNLADKFYSETIVAYCCRKICSSILTDNFGVKKKIFLPKFLNTICWGLSERSNSCYYFLFSSKKLLALYCWLMIKSIEIFVWFLDGNSLSS